MLGELFKKVDQVLCGRRRIGILVSFPISWFQVINKLQLSLGFLDGAKVYRIRFHDIIVSVEIDDLINHNCHIFISLWLILHFIQHQAIQQLCQLIHVFRGTILTELYGRPFVHTLDCLPYFFFCFVDVVERLNQENCFKGLSSLTLFASNLTSGKISRSEVIHGLIHPHIWAIRHWLAANWI